MCLLSQLLQELQERLKEIGLPKVNASFNTSLDRKKSDPSSSSFSVLSVQWLLPAMESMLLLKQHKTIIMQDVHQPPLLRHY
jgi:hypothetical protein